MVRTYEDIINDYIKWKYELTNDEFYNIATFYNCESMELVVRKGRIWDEILTLSYSVKQGMYYFHKFILGDMKYGGYPQSIRFNKLWLEWSELSKEGDHLCILCARQHSKSTFWSVFTTIYRTCLFDNYNVLIESASEDQAMNILNQIVKLIESNEFLSSKKSSVAKWSSSEIHYNGGKILARGVGSEVRGGTYDYIVIDDILRSDNKFSDDQIVDFIDEELEPMIMVRKGQIVIVGTPKAEGDIFTIIRERSESSGGWIMEEYPAIIDMENRKLLCPDRFTWEQMMKKRSVMGELKFNKEMMCQVYSSGTQLFPPALTKKAMEMGKVWTVYPSIKGSDRDKWYYYMACDTARAGSASADYTVCIVLAFNPVTQQKRVVWMWREKGLKTSEQVQEIAKIAKNFDYPPILVEKNNLGIDFIDMLIDNYNLNVEAFTTTPQNKEDLIRFLINAFENEKMILPTGDDRSRAMTKIIVDELHKFVVEITSAGNEVLKGSGRSKDDTVMSLCFALKCSQGYGGMAFANSLAKSDKATDLERYVSSNDLLDVFKF